MREISRGRVTVIRQAHNLKMAVQIGPPQPRNSKPSPFGGSFGFLLVAWGARKLLSSHSDLQGFSMFFQQKKLKVGVEEKLCGGTILR